MRNNRIFYFKKKKIYWKNN